jgi:hypothetical protein
MGEINAYRILVERSKRKSYLGDLDADVNQISSFVWSRFVWLWRGTSGGCCEHGNKPLGSINGAEYFDQLSDYYILKEDSVTHSLCVNRSISFQNMTFFWVVALCSRDSSP